MSARRVGTVLLLAATAVALLLIVRRARTPVDVDVRQARAMPVPDDLERHCRELIGEPRVEEVAPDVFVAIGYDLANTVLVRTDAGNVVVDVSLSPERARPVHAALTAAAPGPTAAVVYTHSHIDHVGGADVWANADTPIWATDRFRDGFFNKYGVFRRIETIRGARQFGRHVTLEQLPCSSLGRQVDIDAALRTGVLMPTRTFSGEAAFEVGGVRFELFEAPGETEDQLFVWLPAQRVLLPGDNFYAAFPNLYTIRGSRPRPVGDWIDSLDAMRRLSPEVLVPSHTAPIVGEAEVARRLTTYRDGVQWVHDQVVRGANQGLGPDAIAATTGLPPSLADAPDLRELYGQIDWSARAIYDNELGWFDGRPELLYPLPPAERASRQLALMGGADRVIGEARVALAADDPQWALELLAIAEAAGPPPELADELSALIATALQDRASAIANTNGRAYLLESAWERGNGGPADPEVPEVNDELVAAIPLDVLFAALGPRLIPGRAMDLHESVRFEFTGGERWNITIRNGVAEVVSGEPLPGTPPPVATVRTDADTWRALALGRTTPVRALASGDLDVDGLAAFRAFMDRFDRGL